jgi:CheY-like chemotaxis protein
MLETAGYDCSEAADGLHAVEKTATLQPDLLIVDLGMPNLSGIQVASLLRQSTPGVKVILLTMNHDVGRNLTSALGDGAVIVHRLVDGVHQLLTPTPMPPPLRPDNPMAA